MKQLIIACDSPQVKENSVPYCTACPRIAIRPLSLGKCCCSEASGENHFCIETIGKPLTAVRLAIRGVLGAVVDWRTSYILK